MKPRFFIGLLSLVFLVAPASRANGFPASELVFVAIASPQEDVPEQSPLDHQKDRQGTIRSDEKVVVTAEREIENIRNIGSSVSLITSDEITASGASVSQSVAEARKSVVCAGNLILISVQVLIRFWIP